MKIYRVNTRDLHSFIEDMYSEKYPEVLGKMKESLNTFNSMLNESLLNLQYLIHECQNLETEQEMLNRCISLINHSFLPARIVMDRYKLKDHIESSIQNLNSVSIIFHSFYHAHIKSKKSLRPVCDQITVLLARTVEESSNILSEKRKSTQIYLYFERVLQNFASKTKDFVNFQSQSELFPDSYLSALTWLIGKGNTPKVSSDPKKAVIAFYQSKVLETKLENCLEIPALMALEYLKEEGEKETKDEKHMTVYNSIICKMNNSDFVRQDLIKFEPEDVIEAIRELMKMTKIPEFDSKIFVYLYDEEMFLDLYYDYKLALAQCKSSGYREWSQAYKDLRITNSESKTGKDFSEKAFDHMIRNFESNLSQDEFCKPREEVQDFFLQEFGIIVNLLL